MTKAIIGMVGSELTKPDTNFIDSKVEYIQNVSNAAIREAGGLPIGFSIPGFDEDEFAQEYMNQVDALFLLGGEDVDPSFYGQDPNMLLQDVDQARDRFELALFKVARQQKKPIFGICRGMQMINVASGGSLFQDLSLIQAADTAVDDTHRTFAGSVRQAIKHGQLPTPVGQATHHIDILSNTWLYGILGHEYFVNTVHHQVIDKLANDLAPVATAPDGMIEAISSQDNLVWGVQFHPEWLFEKDKKMANVFTKFVKKALEVKLNKHNNIDVLNTDNLRHAN